MRVDEALCEARRAGVDRLDAQLMLGRVLGRPRAWVLAHDDAVFDAPQCAAWRLMLARRSDGEPLAYILGVSEFYGIGLQVDARVLVPRADTETLVDWALELASHAAAGQAAIDLGTGSGAIAIAFASACRSARVSAVDASADALAVARANAERLGLAIEFLSGDWWDAVEGRRFDLALANPPYIAAADAHLAALRHEPIAALASGADGLHDLRRIVRAAPPHLRAGAWLLLEHGHDQAQAVRALLSEAGFDGVTTRLDLARRPRISGGHIPCADSTGTRSTTVGQ